MLAVAADAVRRQFRKSANSRVDTPCARPRSTAPALLHSPIRKRSRDQEDDSGLVDAMEDGPQQQQQKDGGDGEAGDAANGGKRAPRAPSSRPKRPKLTAATLRVRAA